MGYALLDAYRYGFNGKEKDTDGEWGNLTHYDYGFRIYNPGIGKFLSVDPLTKSYPELTPYQFAHNSPISAIDMDGLEAEGTNKKVDNSLKHKEGLTFFWKSKYCYLICKAFISTWCRWQIYLQV